MLKDKIDKAKRIQSQRKKKQKTKLKKKMKTIWYYY